MPGSSSSNPRPDTGTLLAPGKRDTLGASNQPPRVFLFCTSWGRVQICAKTNTSPICGDNVRGLGVGGAWLEEDLLHRTALRVSHSAARVQKWPSCECLLGAVDRGRLIICRHRLSQQPFCLKNIHLDFDVRQKRRNLAHTKATSAQLLPNHSHEGQFCAG